MVPPIDDQVFGFANTIDDNRADTVAQGGEEELRVIVRETKIGRYKILDILGSGGMGIVYLAFDPQLDRKVACKVLRETCNTAAQLRLQREAKAMAKLSHPNVVRVYEVGSDDKQVYIVMELVDGQDMESWCRSNRSEREILAAYLQAGEGLAAAHRAGLVHRDFKPQNVLIDKEGRVLVTDFGLAIQNQELSIGGMLTVSPADGVLASDKITRPGVVMGTPVYMAPEQHLARQVDARSDQFSFCVSLYEALSGEPPYPGNSYDSLREQVLNGEARPLPKSVDVPSAVRAAIEKGLSRKPQDRFLEMSDLLRSLGYRGRRRRIGRAALIGISMALLLIGGAAVFLLAADETPATSCEADPRILDGVWDAEIRNGLSSDFIATGVPGAARGFELFSSLLDSYADKFIEVRKNICEENQGPKTLGDEVYLLQLECLQKLRLGFGALANAFSGIEANGVGRAMEAAMGLPDASSCEDLEAIGKRVTAPPKYLSHEVAALRATLEEARSLGKAGKLELAISLAELVRDKSVGIAYIPLRAEAHFELGELLLDSVRIGEARKMLDEAVTLAEESDHARVRAYSLVSLTELFGSHSSDAKEARRYFRLARAAIEHFGESHELVFQLNLSESRQRYYEGEVDEALALLLTLLRRVESWEEETSIWRATLHYQLSDYFHGAGNAESAYQAALQAHKLVQMTLGDQHPRRIRYLGNVANFLRVLGQGEAAHELHVIARRYWSQDSSTVFFRGSKDYLAKSRDVSGQVVDDSGDPVSNAVVVCGHLLSIDGTHLDSGWDTFRHAVNRVRVVRSGADGGFACNETSTKRLAVVAEHSNRGRSLPTLKPASDRDLSGLVLKLKATGTLVGKIVDPSAGPGIRQVIAVLEGDDLWAPSYKASTPTSGGRYRFDRLAEGRYHIRISGEGATGKSSVMVHLVDVVGTREVFLDFTAASGSAGLRFVVSGEPGTQMFSVLTLLVTGHHEAHSAAEFGVKVFSSDITLRERYLVEGDVLTYHNLAPGPYTMCLVPLNGDQRNPEYFATLSDATSGLVPYHCHHLQLKADTIYEDTTKVPPYRSSE